MMCVGVQKRVLSDELLVVVNCVFLSITTLPGTVSDQIFSVFLQVGSTLHVVEKALIYVSDWNVIVPDNSSAYTQQFDFFH